MKVLRQMGSGLIIGAVSLMLVIGGISLSLAETSAPSLPPTPSPIPTTFAVEFASPLPLPTLFIETPTNVTILIPTETLSLAQPTSCTVPAGWVAITVGTNDTLYSIAERYKTTADNLDTSNCLKNILPAAGSRLYVPPVPTVTVIPCGAPSSWVRAHTVKAGENLFRISLLYRTTVTQLQSANCMGSSTIIHVGQLLWVPNVPTSTPGITVVPTSTINLSTPTNTATRTPDFSTPTNTATNTPVPTATETPTPSLTSFPTQATP